MLEFLLGLCAGILLSIAGPMGLRRWGRKDIQKQVTQDAIRRVVDNVN